MRQRVIYAKSSTLTEECKREMQQVLRNHLSKAKFPAFCEDLQQRLSLISKDWPWNQSPVHSQAKPVLNRLLESIREVENDPGLLEKLDRSYRSTYEACHIRALDGNHVQASEMLARLRAGVVALIKSNGKPGRPSYDAGLLWLVHAIVTIVYAWAPKAQTQLGNKGIAPSIIRSVIEHQVVYLESHSTKPGKVKLPERMMDLIKSALEKGTKEVPPPLIFTTTTTPG